MTEDTTPTAAALSPGRVEPVDLRVEMERSYLDYAMSVIVGRALPDVRDGMKPVHRRVLYAMFEGGYRPDRGFSKCARIVGDVMANYHPHGDGAIYDTLVRLAQPWVLRYPLVAGQGNFGSPGNDPAAAMRYTECRMAPLAMEMVRDIDQDTVDFVPNYDDRATEPTVLPARFPNLLVNGSAGIAVGMATNIPPHNLREVADGVRWSLDNPDATREELLAALMERIKGPDFPLGAQIVGRRGIEEAYRTGRGSVVMRAVIDVEEEARTGRTLLVITELPYQVNPDNLAMKIAELVNAGKLHGIADIRDDTSSRTGQRLVIVLKRDAVATVVRNNLLKHTQLQETFGCNMVALVDGVPRTLSLDGFIRHWITHQLEVIRRRSEFRLRKRRERLHIVAALLLAIDAIDEVVALIRSSESQAHARERLMERLEIDEIQAKAILDLPLGRLAALERLELSTERDQLVAEIADLEDIIASDQRKRDIVRTEMDAVVERFGDARRTQIVPAEGTLDDEDLIPVEDVVVTITRTGYAKRTKAGQYRLQHRGGKGVRGAQLREDDVVEHFFVTTTHHWLLFFTDRGRVYRVKAHQLPEAGRDARGQHVANLLAFQPDEAIAAVQAIQSYDAAPYLVLATAAGLVKKSALADYDSPRSGGLIGISLREDDALIGAELAGPDDDVLLVSARGSALRFGMDDDQVRRTGRNTAGVIGMKFRGDDRLLAMAVIKASADVDTQYLFTLTASGTGKRTNVEEYRRRNRAGLGVQAARLVGDADSLVGALVVQDGDEVMTIRASGAVTRSKVADVRPSGRVTSGVRFVQAGDDAIVALARVIEPEDDGNEPVEPAETPAGDVDGAGAEATSVDGAQVATADAALAEPLHADEAE